MSPHYFGGHARPSAFVVDDVTVCEFLLGAFTGAVRHRIPILSMPWSDRLRADWHGSCPPLGEVICVARTVPKGVAELCSCYVKLSGSLRSSMIWKNCGSNFYLLFGALTAHTAQAKAFAHHFVPKILLVLRHADFI